jgi:hypothetical protein
MIVSALGRGLQAARSGLAWRALGWCYLVCLAVALAVFVPVFAFVRSTVAGSTMSSELAVGSNANWLVDLIGKPGASFAMSSLLLISFIAAIVYVVGVAVLSGGVFAYLASALGVRDRDSSFLVECARTAGPLVRIALLELPVVVVVGLVFVLARLALEALDAPGSLSWFLLAAAAFVLAFVTSIFDYARIHVVTEGSRSALRSLLAASRFTVENLVSVAGIAAATVLLACVVFVVGVWLHGLVPLDTGLLVLVGLLLGQLAIAARLWTRLVAYASEMALWSASRAKSAKIQENG